MIRQMDETVKNGSKACGRLQLTVIKFDDIPDCFSEVLYVNRC